jgi:hypothetical protein
VGVAGGNHLFGDCLPPTHGWVGSTIWNIIIIDATTTTTSVFLVPNKLSRLEMKFIGDNKKTKMKKGGKWRLIKNQTKREKMVKSEIENIEANLYFLKEKRICIEPEIA